MQVRVFEAPDMAAGLRLVKEALGPDALILSTRSIRRGKLGLLSKPLLEITAAVDERWSKEEAAPASSVQVQPPRDPARVQTASPGHAAFSYDNIRRSAEPDPAPAQPVTAQSLVPDDTRQLRNELQELRHLIQGLAGRMPAASQTAPYVEPEFIRRQPQTDRNGEQAVVQLLCSMGVDRQTAATINRFAEEELSAEQLRDTTLLRDFLVKAIAGVLRTSSHLPAGNGRQRRLALVGATGVGKTTTIAKLAASSMGSLGGNIALITIDTYRIAAVEQLKVYSEIMRLPLEVVIRPQELARALERHRDRDLILIDTAGRSPRNGAALGELAEFFLPEWQIEPHLVLPAPTRDSELEDTIARFSCLPLASFIFTKLDECGHLGVLLNTQLKHGTPISFLTNGQRVPEDILTAEPAQLADMILSHDGACYHG